jgi:chromosome segregation ATPase
MRAPDLGGLIYDGAGEDHAGRAQVTHVSLYFDNSDRGLAVDRKTVIIGRDIVLPDAHQVLKGVHPLAWREVAEPRRRAL